MGKENILNFDVQYNVLIIQCKNYFYDALKIPLKSSGIKGTKYFSRKLCLGVMALYFNVR